MDWRDVVVCGIIITFLVLIYSVLAAITRYCMRDDKNRSPVMQIFSLLWNGVVLVVLGIVIILCIVVKILVSI